MGCNGSKSAGGASEPSDTKPQDSPAQEQQATADEPAAPAEQEGAADGEEQTKPAEPVKDDPSPVENITEADTEDKAKDSQSDPVITQVEGEEVKEEPSVSYNSPTTSCEPRSKSHISNGKRIASPILEELPAKSGTATGASENVSISSCALREQKQTDAASNTRVDEGPAPGISGDDVINTQPIGSSEAVDPDETHGQLNVPCTDEQDPVPDDHGMPVGATDTAASADVLSNPVSHHGADKEGLDPAEHGDGGVGHTNPTSDSTKPAATNNEEDQKPAEAESKPEGAEE